MEPNCAPDFVTPKFQVSPTSVSRTSKNGCKFNFTTARLVLWLALTSCIGMYSPLFYFISIFFFARAFLLFFYFYVDFLFLFIHYSSVSFIWIWLRGF